jgi:tight adherence protein B
MLAGLVVVAVFLTIVLVVWGLYALVAEAPAREQERVVRHRLDSLVRAQERGSSDRSVELFKQEILSSLPRIQRALLRFPRAYALQEALRQADWRISVLTFLLLSAVVGGATFALGLALTHSTLLAGVFAALAASGPYIYLTYCRRKRLDKFLEQCPDAIELLARAVRAGHAITTGLDMVADEMEDPIAGEFRQAYDEQKFGLPVHQALLNLQERVPLLEMRILVTAIAIQREVGGNLAEVLDNLAHTIRERFKIRRQVKVYTAQGRLTGYILVALPVIVGFMLLAINPQYFKILLQHEYGIFMIGTAALLQIAGYFWIRKIIHIRI